MACLGEGGSGRRKAKQLQRGGGLGMQVRKTQGVWTMASGEGGGAGGNKGAKRRMRVQGESALGILRWQGRAEGPV